MSSREKGEREIGDHEYINLSRFTVKGKKKQNEARTENVGSREVFVLFFYWEKSNIKVVF